MAGSPKHARNTRSRKRVPVAFSSAGAPAGSGYTVDVSSKGVGVSTAALHPKGTRLMLDLVLDGQVARIHGEVVWAKKPELRGNPGMMGLRIVAADPRFHMLVLEANGRKSTPPPPKVLAPPPPTPEVKPTYVYPVENTFTMVATEEQSADESVVMSLLREMDDWEDAFGPEQGTPEPRRIRRPTRHEVTLKAKVASAAHSDHGATIDVSATGLSIKASAFFVPGTRLTVDLAVGSRSAKAQGEVVRITLQEDGSHIIGLRLVEADGRYETLVRRLAIDPDRDDGSEGE